MKNTDTVKMSQEIENVYNKSASYWQRTERKMVINLLKSVSKNVPAYGKFLRKQRITIQKIKSYKDFLQIPRTSKKNYISLHSIAEITDAGKLNKPLIFTSTSGSTGKPFYFH